MLAGLKEKFNKLSPTAKLGSVAFALALVGGAGFMGYRTYQNRQVAEGGAAVAKPATGAADSADPAAASPNVLSADPSAKGPANVPQPKDNKPAGARIATPPQADHDDAQ